MCACVQTVDIEYVTVVAPGWRWPIAILTCAVAAAAGSDGAHCMEAMAMAAGVVAMRTPSRKRRMRSELRAQEKRDGQARGDKR